MARHFGIPYMGSKQKLVDKLVPYILKKHPDTSDFYDLFGGGGSVSLYTVQKYPDITVHYNELSLAVGRLMQHLQNGGDIPQDFVTHEEFKKSFRGDTWEAGLLQTCWTFANNQNNYLYSREIELFKKKLDELVKTGKGDIGYIEDFASAFAEKKGQPQKVKLLLDSRRYASQYQRRIVASRQIPLIGQLQHLPRLEALEHVKNLRSLQRLEITVGSGYNDVKIEGTKPIAYCDPPYENTFEYKEGSFSHKDFYDWAASRDFPVYISSFKVSDSRFKLVKAIKTRSLARSNMQNVYNFENLYWNGIE